MKKSILLGAILFCGLGLAGCGNSTKSSSTSHKAKVTKVAKKTKHSSTKRNSKSSSKASSESAVSSSVDNQTSTTQASQVTSQQASQPASSNTSNDSSASNGDSVYTDDQGNTHHVHMTGQQYMGSNLGTDEVTGSDGVTRIFEHDTPAN